METVTFTINKGNSKKEYVMDICETIETLKNNIRKDFNLSVKYIDIDFQVDRPIRTLGKFNLEAGILPRTLDIYSFDNFGIKGRHINATFIEVFDYTPIKTINNSLNINKYNQDKTYVQSKSIQTLPFNLESEDDFPSLS